MTIHVQDGAADADRQPGQGGGGRHPRRARSRPWRRAALAVACVLPAWWSAPAAAQATCSTENEVRLVRGTSSSGSVEVCDGERWGSVCDDGWNNAGAGVLCRQLGYPEGGTATDESTFGLISPAHYWSRRISCTGAEAALHLCTVELQESQTSCHFSERAGVNCTVPKLVSNLDQEGDDSTSGIRPRAQAFTTGPSPGGYELDRVEVNSEDAEGDEFTVSVCAVDSSNHPTDTCTDLAAPGSFAAGTLGLRGAGGHRAGRRHDLRRRRGGGGRRGGPGLDDLRRRGRRRGGGMEHRGRGPLPGRQRQLANLHQQRGAAHRRLGRGRAEPAGHRHGDDLRQGPRRGRR